MQTEGETTVAAAHPVAAAAAAALDQCAAFVDGIADGQYAAESTVMAGGTVGKHVRHVLDHFRAIVLRDGVIDYDRRERNVPMETDRGEALAAIRSLRAVIAGLDEGELVASVRVRVMLAADGSGAELTSTMGRELAFAAHHAVHHQAMLRAIGEELGARACEGFGVAPATQNHLRDSQNHFRGGLKAGRPN